jgi:hypothetical protein
MCVRGTSWVRKNILEKYPDEEITVYAVWFDMIATDRKDRWNPTALNDSRVKHYWDEERSLGKWLTQNMKGIKHLGPIDWDSYYLFDTEATWTDTLNDLKANGTPILDTTEALEMTAARMFETTE